MKRSRSGQCGFLGSCLKNPPKYSAVTTSVADNELLGWPEPASVVILRMSSRIDLARRQEGVKVGHCYILLDPHTPVVARLAWGAGRWDGQAGTRLVNLQTSSGFARKSSSKVND